MIRYLPLLLLPLLACDEPAAPAAPDALELRSYPVDPALANEVSAVINRLLGGGKEEAPVGRAQVAPAGQLLVAAPPRVHAGVADLMKRLAEAPPKAAPSVELTYWIVRATPTAQPAPLPAALREIDKGIALLASQGPAHFTLIERLSAVQESGADVRIEGRRVEIQHEASARDGRVVARLRVRYRGAVERRQGVKHRKREGELKVTTQLPLDQLLVLGQSGLDGEAPDGPIEQLYYIVRARVIDVD